MKEDKIDTIEKMEKEFGPTEEGETREIWNGWEDDYIEHIKETLEKNYSISVWTKGWSEEEKIAESRRLTEGGIVHCWDKTMDAFLLFRCGEDLIHFYESVLGIKIGDID